MQPGSTHAPPQVPRDLWREAIELLTRERAPEDQQDANGTHEREAQPE